MKAEIIKPYGFCGGVTRTIELAKDLKINNPEKDIVLLGYPVHNEDVISDLLDSHVKIVDGTYDDFIEYLKCFGNDNAIYVLSAHGHANDIIQVLNDLNLQYLDTTCPYIKQIHKKLENIDPNENVLYIGNENHIECITSLRHIKSENITVKKSFTLRDLIQSNKFTLVNQSTYYIKETIDDLKYKYLDNIKNMTIMDNFCPSVDARLKQIQTRVNEFECFIIIGSKTSSNAKTIERFCNSLFKKTYFIERYDDFLYYKEILMACNKKIGIVTATSVSASFAEKIYDALNSSN